MKKIMPLLLIAVLAFGAYYVFTSGMLTGTGDVGVNAPKDGPDLPDAPDIHDVGDGAGKAAEGAEKGAKQAADTIAGLSPAVWRVLSIVLVLLCLMWVWKDPKRRSIALGIGLIGLLIFIMSNR